MFKKGYLFFALLFSFLYSAPNLTTTSYYDSIPYKYVARVTCHKAFTNLYLNDGTVFRINDCNSSAQVCKWYINDPVIIYPNHSLFHSEDYYLYNENSKGCAYGNISCSPNANDLNYFQIVEISYSNNVITLVNGTQTRFYFEVSPEHIYKVSSWLVQDCLILGWDQDTWGYNTFPYILINTNKNEYVNSKYLQY
jgi:hypothetical protein